MIEVNNVSYVYSRNHMVFESLSFLINEGELWGILGRNGAGKTTLIDLILGIKYPTTGSVKVLGKPANKSGVEN